MNVSNGIESNVKKAESFIVNRGKNAAIPLLGLVLVGIIGYAIWSSVRESKERELYNEWFEVNLKIPSDSNVSAEHIQELQRFIDKSSSFPLVLHPTVTVTNRNFNSKRRYNA